MFHSLKNMTLLKNTQIKSQQRKGLKMTINTGFELLKTLEEQGLDYTEFSKIGLNEQDVCDIAMKHYDDRDFEQFYVLMCLTYCEFYDDEMINDMTMEELANSFDWFQNDLWYYEELIQDKFNKLSSIEKDRIKTLNKKFTDRYLNSNE